MSNRAFDSRAAAIARKVSDENRRQLGLAPPLPSDVPLSESDPTFDIRRRQANLCEAVMVRVFELEAQAAALTETAKKLRAAVLANT